MELNGFLMPHINSVTGQAKGQDHLQALIDASGITLFFFGFF